MKILKYIPIILLTLAFTGCEEVVSVDLNSAAPRLVIDASIDWYKGTDGSQQKIRLTTTAPYYDDNVPVVSDAEVFVTNSASTVFNFVEVPGTGNYVCNNFVPQIGETYELTVITGGQTYTATETMYAAPDISDTVEQDDNSGFGDEIELKFFFMDTPGEYNAYMTRLDADVHPFPDYDVFDDEFFEGNEMFGIYIDEDYETGTVTKFYLYGISERYKNYMNILLNAAEGSDGPFQTTPSNARGNIVNQTNHSNFAWGYFRLSEVDTKDYIVQ